MWNRREVLQGSTVALAGLALSARLAAEGPPKPAPATPAPAPTPAPTPAPAADPAKPATP